MKILSHTLIWAALLVLPFTANALADYETGVVASENGDYAKAMHDWESAAEAGSSNAAFALGMLYVQGRGAPKNYKLAAQWYERAASIHACAVCKGSEAMLYMKGGYGMSSRITRKRWNC